jgi:hypothetical protein
LALGGVVKFQCSTLLVVMERIENSVIGSGRLIENCAL